MDFTDDLPLLYSAYEQLQMKTTSVAAVSAALGINTHKDKSKILKFNMENTNPVAFDGEALEGVETFMYLDSIIIDEQGGSDANVKAAVVSLVKDQLNAQTLAIGDGANDVNMIQVANVGIGINSGEEGMQAVMASDFAISRFYLLKQLLLVHGHWCYDKLAHASLYLFYKDADSM
ncbi:unnamed protein product [Schistosoma margrebowiei]|uniref:Uncharacterized protein n=1 Tax=Schistosoma margrebowiei TaxID=48269 RepID=A0A183MTL4_9TREM|nr:unnamed protein product [Schistosoma margrebowiei]